MQVDSEKLFMCIMVFESKMKINLKSRLYCIDIYDDCKQKLPVSFGIWTTGWIDPTGTKSLFNKVLPKNMLFICCIDDAKENAFL